MKEKSLTSILLAVLLVFVCIAAGLGFICNRRISQLRKTQGTIAVMQQGNAAIQVIGADVLEYSKNNPGINPILQSFGLKFVTNTIQPAKLPQK